MKKILALCLAVGMMSTTAFAASTTIFGDGYDGEPANGTSNIVDTGEFAYGPGDEIEITSSMLNDEDGEDVSDLNTDNYSIKKVTYQSGKSYIDSIVLDDDEGDELTVTFKDDYSVSKSKDIEVSIELRGKGSDVDVKTVYIQFSTEYGLDTQTVYIDSDGDIDEGELDFEKINEFESDDDGMSYGTLSFDTDDGDTSVEARVYDGDEFYLGHDYDADKKVLVANADAEISFLNFPAKPTFNSTATVYFYQVDEDGYIYEITSAGKIKASSAKWSDDDGCWVLKTRTLGSYVFSDEALVSATSSDDASDDDDTAADGTVEIPDTGANDVVGIATALAVVSLVAAGAVALKKK